MRPNHQVSSITELMYFFSIVFWSHDIYTNLNNIEETEVISLLDSFNDSCNESVSIIIPNTQHLDKRSTSIHTDSLNVPSLHMIDQYKDDHVT